jgi:hypothetical protein
MQATIRYFETGSKSVEEVSGELFFGDALLQDYTGIWRKRENGVEKTYALIPSACIIKITLHEMDEELYMVNTDNMKISKQRAMNRMESDFVREQNDGRAFQ